jgi:histidinol-phosphatase (PHP family)
MYPASYHVHTTFCDGSVSPEEMVRAAIGQNMKAIGFSAHAAWPFATVWHLPVPRYAEYVAEIARLKTAYADKVEILCGFEADWIPGVSAPDRSVYAQFKPDYLIGSVHYVQPERTRMVPARANGQRDGGAPSLLWSVDAGAEEVQTGLDAAFGGDGKKAVSAYYSAIRDMVRSCRFDIVGHLDLPRKRNGKLRFFDETAGWYRRELKETVREIAGANLVVELNTGAIARKAMDAIYPSDELLSLLRHAGVPVTLNSDAHAPGDLTCAYDRALDALRRTGYRELSFLTETGWKAEKI